jgi:hypothetical protein
MMRPAGVDETGSHQVEATRVRLDARKAMGRWIVALAVTLAFFYGLDHVLMSAQGLPLSWNMAPGN